MVVTAGRTNRPIKTPQGDSCAQERETWPDGMRGFAALAVVIGHCWWYVNINTLGAKFLGTVAAMMVAIFIFLSGYLLGLAPARNGLRLASFREYLRRRILRIFPAYYATLLLSAGWHWWSVGDIDPINIIGPALLIQDYIGLANFNGSLWSMAVEWHAYFLMPVILWVIRQHGLKGLICFVVLACLADAILFIHGFTWARTYLFAFFATGVYTAWCKEQGRVMSPVQSVSLVALGIGGIIGVIILFGFRPDLLNVGTMCFLPSAVGIFHLAMRDGRWLQTKPLTTVGGFSYSLYLIHLPVVETAIRTLGSRGVQDNLELWTMAIAVPISVAVAWLASKFLETAHLRRANSYSESGRRHFQLSRPG